MAATSRKGANTARKRNALGRGLSALMSATAVEVDFTEDEQAAPETVTQPSIGTARQGLRYLPLIDLAANSSQPRQNFNDEEIDQLADSIKQSGLLQPILVRPLPEPAIGAKFEIIAGERRFRAAKKAGLAQLPVIVKDLDDREVLEVAIVENIQRSQLNPIEEAMAYRRLKEEFSLSQEEIAKTVGKDRATIANTMRLLKLTPKMQDSLVSGALSAGHARALLGLADQSLAESLGAKVLRDGLSVRATEELVRSYSGDGPRGPKKGDKSKRSKGSTSTSSELEERFRRALGTKVKVEINSKGAGELRISFFSQDELDKLIEILNA